MPRRFAVTEEESIQLGELVDAYWEEFSALVDRHLAKCPHPDLADLMEMQMSEHSSVYGRKSK